MTIPAEAPLPEPTPPFPPIGGRFARRTAPWPGRILTFRERSGTAAPTPDHLHDFVNAS